MPLAILVAGCNSGGGTSLHDPSTDPPTNLQAIVADGEITLSWSPAPEADSYHLYYAHESGIDPKSYAAYEGGTWLQDVSSPLILNLENKVPVYRFTVTAVSEDIESPPSNEAIAVIRYVLGEDGATVIDLTTGLEWMRCSWGQVWNQAAQICDGDLLRGNSLEILAGRPSSEWSIPTVEQFTTIRFCDSGTQTAYFPGQESFSPPNQLSTCEPQGEHGVYVDAFPPSSFGAASNYMTSSIGVGSLCTVRRTFSFGQYGGIIASSVCEDDPEVFVYGRFVRSSGV